MLKSDCISLMVLEGKFVRPSVRAQGQVKLDLVCQEIEPMKYLILN